MARITMSPPHAIRSRSVRELRELLGLSRERMARLLDVSTKTIERWEASDTVPINRSAVERLGKLNQIVDLGQQVYTSEGLRAFMSQPMPAFRGRTAFQVIEAGEPDRVYGELAADYEGAGY